MQKLLPADQDTGTVSVSTATCHQSIKINLSEEKVEREQRAS